MKNKITPGPWKWNEVCSSYDPRKTVVMELKTECIPEVPHNDKTILCVREDFIRAFKDVDNANARLIAAAPELLEALWGCIYLMRRLEIKGIALENAEAAFLKATGQK